MGALKIGWDFFQNEVLGMGWLSRLISTMPAIVVNEKVVAMGKVLKANEVVALLRKLGF